MVLDIRVKSAPSGTNAARMPSAFISSMSLRFHENVILGSQSATSCGWKLLVSACHDSAVNDGATDSTLFPVFGSNTVIVNDESPYGRSTAWYAGVSAYAIFACRDISFAGWSAPVAG